MPSAPCCQASSKAASVFSGASREAPRWAISKGIVWVDMVITFPDYYVFSLLPQGEGGQRPDEGGQCHHIQRCPLTLTLSHRERELKQTSTTSVSRIHALDLTCKTLQQLVPAQLEGRGYQTVLHVPGGQAGMYPPNA